MSAAELRCQLNARISYMATVTLPRASAAAGRGIRPEVINMFLHEADMMLNDITSLLNLPIVDFEMVGKLVHQLKACSGSFLIVLFLACISVGARKVNLACVHFQQFYVGKSKERCLMALNVLRNEFYDVHDRLQTIMQVASYFPMLAFDFQLLASINNM
ncbi:hypothetical protein VPH35_071000 [Triticum aestivum]